MTLISMTAFSDSVHEIGWSGGNPGGALPAGRPGSTVGSSNNNPLYTFPAANANSIVFGFAYYYNNTAWSNGFICTIDNGSTTQWTIKATQNNAPTSTLGLYNSAGTLVAQTVDAYPIQAWYYFEVKIIPGASGTGHIIVRINGIQVIDYSGAAIASIALGWRLLMGWGNGGSISKVTDAYVLDTAGAAPFNDFLGDIQIQTLMPNGNGDVNQWVGSDGNSVDNYLLVDDPNAPNTTDYVVAASTGLSDLYQCADISLTNKDVLAVQPLVYGAKNDTGTPPAMYAQIKQGGVTVKDTNPVIPLSTISTTYQHYPGALQTAAPDGGNWTVAKVNATQVGVST